MKNPILYLIGPLLLSNRFLMPESTSEPGTVPFQFSRLISMAMATMTWLWLILIPTMSRSC
jgi:hypothetical protein